MRNITISNKSVISSSNIEKHLAKAYAIWLREFTIFFRERSRLAASAITPLLWLFAIGSGLGSTGLTTEGVDYQKFIFPGMVSMIVIFTAVVYGAYIIWDKKFDFLKSVMVAPVSSSNIFLGKTLGGMTNSLIQAAIILAMSPVIGVGFDALALVQIIAIVLILSFALTSLGLSLGSYIQSLEGFQGIVGFIVFPLFFFSGALFPIDNLPSWLSILTNIDPATYAVDAMRNTMFGLGSYTFGFDIAILLAYAAGLGLLGVYSFARMKAV